MQLSLMDQVGRGGSIASSCEQPVTMARKVGWLGGGQEPWAECCSPQDPAACPWPSHFVPVADRSSSQLMPHHKGRVWRPHLTDRHNSGWCCSIQGTNPSWESETNQRWRLLKWQESLILYVCTERNNQSTRPWAIHNISGITACRRALLIKDL